MLEKYFFSFDKNLDLHYSFVLMFFSFPSRNFFCHVGTISFLSMFNQYYAADKKMSYWSRNTVTPLAVSLKLAILRSPVKRSTKWALVLHKHVLYLTDNTKWNGMARL